MTRKKPSYHYDSTPPSYVVLVIAFVIISVLAVARVMQTHWYTPKPENPIQLKIEQDEKELGQVQDQLLATERMQNDRDAEIADMKVEMALAQKNIKDLEVMSNAHRIIPDHWDVSPQFHPTGRHPTKASRALFHTKAVLHRKQVFGWGTGGDCWSTQEWDRGL